MAPWIEDLKKKHAGKVRLRAAVVMDILDIKRTAFYDLLADGHLEIHHKDGVPGVKGLFVVTDSLWRFLEAGCISREEWQSYRAGLPADDDEKE